MVDKEDIILIAEDDPEDQLLLQEAFEAIQIQAKVYFTLDGEELLDFLNNRGKYADKGIYHRPKLILLDLNMPRKDGFETLEEIKNTPNFKCIPTVILTTSDHPDHVQKTYKLGGNSYIRKPNTFRALMDMIETIKIYWLDISKYPRTFSL